MADDDRTEEQEPSLQEKVEEAIGLTDSTESAGDASAASGADAESGAQAAAATAADTGAAASAATSGAAATAAQTDPKAADTKPPVDKNADLYRPLPETNARTTHERFQKLVEGHKNLQAEVDSLRPVKEENERLKAAVSDHEQGWQTFANLGFQGDEAVQDLVQFSQYRNALAAGNFDAASRVLQAQARQLALLSGRKIDVDPLAEHQDLSQRVQAGVIDEATAMELARNRHTSQLQQQHAQRQRQESDQITAQTNAIRDAAFAVDEVVQGLMRDPDYQKVEPELLKQLGSIKANYPPSLWPQEIKRAYDTEARILRLQAQQSQPNPTPLRGNGHSGGMPAPTNMQEAVLQSLGLG